MRPGRASTGSGRIHLPRYDDAALRALASDGQPRCMFDNITIGAAGAKALTLQEMVAL